MTYQAYKAQQHTYLVQQQVVEMQQTLRATSWMMTRELRMAGFDASTGKPTNHTTCNLVGTGTAAAPGIVNISPTSSEIITQLDISFDWDGDGKCSNPDNDSSGVRSENVTYMLYLEPDNITRKLVRRDNNGLSGRQEIAKYVNMIDLVYLDASGNPTTNLDRIRSVQLSLLVYGGVGDPKYVNQDTITFPSTANFIPHIYSDFEDIRKQPDSASMHRRQLTTTIRCRNLGLRD
jgi:hypothetical protein